ncbi:hypothetical protein [Bradyrhizobium australafricanum]|uniref:hypothetical protein n=1 Tax=Bradyrhizobium australafricanum TaxID=2821406 RepID=UPI001CE2486F|nr:hypothetical protein [Bradyrhizobium australafricanum]
MTDGLPYWPAALRQDQAAAYCGLSVDTFVEICPVKPIEFTPSSRGRRYLRVRLDAWLDGLDPNPGVPRRRKFGGMIVGQIGS